MEVINKGSKLLRVILDRSKDNPSDNKSISSFDFSIEINVRSILGFIGISFFPDLINLIEMIL
jgi:hypothetical protein